MRHRGPDGQGLYLWPQSVLGHARLAIFDTHPRGAQPMAAAGLQLVFNGAIYNFRALRAQLADYGYRFFTETDTEVILAAWQHWGADCVQRFNGQWALAVLDETQQKLFCCRDRYGIKPLYYTNTNGLFAFASETKAFWAIPGWEAVPSQARVYEFLAYGWQNHHSDHSFYEGVWRLPPGSMLTLDLDTRQVHIATYYQPGDTMSPLRVQDISLPEAIAGVRQRLEEAIACRVAADVPVAMSLSGGIDSSAIAGLAPVALPAFTACFREAGLDELPFVEAVARRRNLQVHRCYPDADYLWLNLESITHYHDEPLGSAAVAAHHQLLQQLRQSGYKVALSGQGADEILAGYDKFYLPHLKSLWRTAPCRAVAELVGAAQRAQWSAEEVVRRLWAYWRPSAHTSLRWLSDAARPDEAQLFKRATDLDIRACSIHLMREVGLPALLHNEDRNAMSHGIESRLPFLDVALVEYCLALPDAYKIRGGIRKYLLREAARDQLPPEVYKRYRKLGFATPQTAWLKAEYPRLEPDLQALSADYPHYFSGQLVPWSRQVAGSADAQQGAALWRVVALGRWLRMLEAYHRQ